MHRRQEPTNKELRHKVKAYERALQLIAHEIHDGFTQKATAALLHLAAFRTNAPQDAGLRWKGFDSAVEFLRLGIIESRRLINQLRQSPVDTLDLKAAIDSLLIEDQCRDCPEVTLCWQIHNENLSPELAHAVFRIVQECLTNIRKHSKSDRAQVRLVQNSDWLHLEVEDWGVGFVAEHARPDCVGLEGILLRARLLGGRARIVSAPGQGTTIVVELPMTCEKRQNKRRRSTP